MDLDARVDEHHEGRMDGQTDADGRMDGNRMTISNAAKAVRQFFTDYLIWVNIWPSTYYI